MIEANPQDLHGGDPSRGGAPRSFFLTGMQRSGTTLLDRLIDRYPEASVMSQPFPLLFVQLKREFLRRLGYGADPYPLGTLFLERRYAPRDFADFLAGFRIDATFLRDVFARMEAFSGQYTRFTKRQLDEVLEGWTPCEPAAATARLLHDLSHKPTARWFGGKETICEEFVPHLLAHGFRAAIILRDVRDVLTSLNHGRGRRFGGSPKPTLFNVRGWRRSVAFALHLEGRGGFGWLCYEDLVASPEERLEQLTEAMDLRVSGIDLRRGLYTSNGASWAGNSSHGTMEGVSRRSTGSYRRALPEEVRRFAEAACWPELTLLGYPVHVEVQEVPNVLAGFRDPYPLDRKDLAAYVQDPGEIEAEIRRFEWWRAHAADDGATGLFLLPGVRARLSEAASAAAG